MYKVTAAIAVGDTLAVGINIGNDSVENELSAKFDKSSVAQSIGVDTDKVPSSNAVKTALDDKFDKANIAQALGSDTDKVPSNKVVNDAISDIIKIKTINIGNISFPGHGYVDISNFKPVYSGFTLINCNIYNYAEFTSGTAGAMLVEGDGNYITGPANSKASSIVVRYIFVKTSSLSVE